MTQPPPARILILDDDPNSVDPHVRVLSQEGYDVTLVKTAEELRAIFSRDRFDIALLDVNLKPRSQIEKEKQYLRMAGLDPSVKEEGEGFRVATWIRDNHPKTGSIILSGERTEMEDKITGLDCGADGYVLKIDPVNELPARVRSLLRRIAPPGAKPLAIGNLVWSADKRTLSTREGRSANLTVAEQKLLEKLYEQPAKNFSRSELYEWIFDRVMISSSDRSIDNVVSRLRSKVKSDLDAELPITTVYGAGYFLNG
jgi:DNA-binding response OmpR family regulator